jgi:hypothetical protein
VVALAQDSALAWTFPLPEAVPQPRQAWVASRRQGIATLALASHHWEGRIV